MAAIEDTIKQLDTVDGEGVNTNPLNVPAQTGAFPNLKQTVADMIAKSGITPFRGNLDAAGEQPVIPGGSGDTPSAQDVPGATAASMTQTREQIEANLSNPRDELAERGLLQDAVNVQDSADQVIDPLQFNVDQMNKSPVAEAAAVLADKVNLGTAEQVTSGSQVTSTDAQAGQVGTALTQGTLVTPEAQQAAAALLPPAEQVQIATDLTSVAAQVALLPPAEQAQAYQDIAIESYEASLIQPDELAMTLQQLKAEEPMQAASMTTELNSLLDGMEDGVIPLWAKPAVTQVERQLQARGISVSSVGRDSLFTAIINAAMPIAQQNATFVHDASKTTYNAKVQALFTDAAIQNSAVQFNAESQNQAMQFNKSMEAQVALSNAARKDAMSQFNVAQLNDFSKVQANIELQTNLRNADAEQRIAELQAQRDDTTNQFNAQQKNQFAELQAQLEQQVELTNTTATNKMAEFNSQREDLRAQFNATQVNDQAKVQARFTQQTNLANAAASNRASEVNAIREDDQRKFNAQSMNDFAKSQAQLDQQINLNNSTVLSNTEQFNANVMNRATEFWASMDSQRDLFNSQQSQAIEQSNVSWRRQINLTNTAIDNQVLATNVQNAFNLSNQALSFLWQEMRDEAQWEFQGDQASLDRRNRLEANVIANEAGAAAEAGAWVSNITGGISLIQKLFD